MFVFFFLLNVFLKILYFYLSSVTSVMNYLLIAKNLKINFKSYKVRSGIFKVSTCFEKVFLIIVILKNWVELQNQFILLVFKLMILVKICRPIASFLKSPAHFSVNLEEITFALNLS